MTGDWKKQVRFDDRARHGSPDLKENIHLVNSGAKDDDKPQAALPRLGDRYDVLGVVGKGGMGSVYKVFDKSINRVMAVKILQQELANDQTALRRFEQEAEAASQLSHNNLVSVFGYGKSLEGAPYLVMDFFEGESLGALLKDEEPLEPNRALNLFHQICEALVHAHEKGVVHRDIKPANIIVSQNENGLETARIVDFGIAKILPVANRETHDLTETRQVFGSPHYMSPEHCLGFKMDERSDIYSLGCLMYEVLTGKPPFSESDAIQVVIKHINEEAKPFPVDLMEDPVCRKLEGVVLKCLEKDVGDRYQSVGDLLRDFDAIKSGKMPSKFVRRKAAKLEYTGTQIVRAMAGTFLLVAYIASALGWFGPLQIGSQVFGIILLLISLVGSYLFSIATFEQYKRLESGKTSRTDWWNMMLATSLAIMCVAILPSAIDQTFGISQDLDYQNARNAMWLNAVTGFALLHIFSMFSVIVSLIGSLALRGAKKTNFYRIWSELVAMVFAGLLIASVCFPSGMSEFSRYVSNSFVISKNAPKLSENMLQLALKLNPLNQSALFDLVQIKVDRGDRIGFEKLFRDYLKQETAPRALATAYFHRAEIYKDNVTWDTSFNRLHDISRAIKYSPRFDYFEERARVHWARGEDEDAKKDFAEAIRSNPDSPSAYVGLAQIYAINGTPQIALAELNDIAAKKAGWTSLDVFFLRGLILAHLDRPNLAQRDFRAVIELAQNPMQLKPEDRAKAACAFRRLEDWQKYNDYIETTPFAKVTNLDYKLMGLPSSWYTEWQQNKEETTEKQAEPKAEEKTE